LQTLIKERGEYRRGEERRGEERRGEGIFRPPPLAET